MAKGFSGINDITDQTSSRGSEHAPQNSAANSAAKTNEAVHKDFVIYKDCKSMPGLWQSQDNGTSWESEDHVFVLQYRPCSQSKVMEHIVNGGKPIGSLVEKEGGLRYWWILCVYYKPWKGPKGDDRMRWPILIITLEQANLKLFAAMTGKSLAELNCDSDGWDEPVLCAFLPGEHVNIKSIGSLLGIKKSMPSPLPTSEKNRMEEIIKKLFLDVACDYVKPSTKPVKLGNMYNGFAAVYSDKIPPQYRDKSLKKNSPGCLGILLFFPAFALFAMIKWIVCG